MAKNPTIPSATPTSAPTFGSASLWKQIYATQEELASKELWEAIRQTTKDNVTLQDEFERLRVLYLLSKKNEGGADGG